MHSGLKTYEIEINNPDARISEVCNEEKDFNMYHAISLFVFCIFTIKDGKNTIRNFSNGKSFQRKTEKQG